LEEAYPTLERNLHVYRPTEEKPEYYVWPHDDLGDDEWKLLTSCREESISITNHRFGAPLN
jgi:hypothetical protein